METGRKVHGAQYKPRLVAAVQGHKMAITIANNKVGVGVPLALCLIDVNKMSTKKV